MIESKGRTTVTAKTKQGVSHTITGTNPYGPPMELFKSLANETYIYVQAHGNPLKWEASIHAEASDNKIETLTTMDVRLEYAIESVQAASTASQLPHVAQSNRPPDTYGDVYDDQDY